MDSLLDYSRKFRNGIKISKPTSKNWIDAIRKGDNFSDDEIVGLANCSYPILHEDVLPLINDFLDFKRAHGSRKEKRIYEFMDTLGLVQRLIANRPLSFVGAGDGYTMRNGKHGSNDWEKVGTDREDKVKMEEYMTYDEIKLAALLQLSSPVLPINTGSRNNIGRVNKDNHVDKAVYVGAVGARYERREGCMEFEETAISKEQNTAENGYGNNPKRPTLMPLFAKFYDVDYFPTFDDVASGRVTHGIAQKHRELYVNAKVYTRRIEISAETFLLEANRRGKESGKKVFAHVVGLGLGCWMFCPDIQRVKYLVAFQNALQKLKLDHVAHVDFSWVAAGSFDGCVLKDGETIPGTDIMITFSRRDPFSQPKDLNMLIVAMYAWDGNSFPGNEYWDGGLSASGDPAAACCTQIPELHNPYVNVDNICAKNLHIASPANGIVKYEDFIILCDS